MTATTFTIERDISGRLVLSPQDSAERDERDGCATTIARYGVAPAVPGALISIAFGISAAGLARLDPAYYREWIEIGTRVFLRAAPWSLIGAYSLPKMLDVLHAAFDKRTERAEFKVPDLPTPRPQRGEPVETLGDKWRRAFERQRSRTSTSKHGSFQQSAQPVQAARVVDWRPEFVHVTRTMYRWCERGGTLTRSAFEQVWRDKWQVLYYRYVGNTEEPITWNNGCWRYLGVVRPRPTASGKPDKRGAVEFAVERLDDILDYARNP